MMFRRKRAAEWGVLKHGSACPRIRVSAVLFCLALTLIGAGCAATMKEQPKYLPLSYSDFYPDHSSARVPPANSVARGIASGDLMTTGKVNGQPSTDFPFPMTANDLQRGQALFNGICAPCHGQTGAGNGVVVQRGFTTPPTLHSDQLRTSPPGFYFDIITNGFGAMPPYGPILQAPDRWRVIAYIRALQLSQNAKLEDVPQDLRGQIKGGGG